MSHDEPSFGDLFPGVTPLKPSQRESNRVMTSTDADARDEEILQKRRQGAETFQLPPDEAHPGVSLDTQTSSSILSYRVPGMQLKRFKRLKTGKLPMQARLDLHGMTVRQATRALNEFIASAQSHEVTQVLIIHGKGHHNTSNEAVLKTHVANYLLQLPVVLAYHSALQKDGGLGALYVLLRKADK